MTRETGRYTPSEAAREASDYFNALSAEQRKKLAPLLTHCRQMGMAEAVENFASAMRRTDARIADCRRNGRGT